MNNQSLHIESAIMQTINTIASAIRPFAAICSYKAPYTHVEPDPCLEPSVHVCIGHFDTFAEAANACRTQEHHPAIINIWISQNLHNGGVQ